MFNGYVSLEMEFLFFGVILGAIAMWIYYKITGSAEASSTSQAHLSKNYVLKEIFDNVQTQVDLAKEDLHEKDIELRSLGGLLAAKEQKLELLEEKLVKEQTLIEENHKRLQFQFEHLANKLLEEKSEKFTALNRANLDGILSPLKDKIKSFEEGIEKRFWQESRDRISLKKEIEQLRELNTQLSQDANNLVSALKGDSKTQGDWGEMQLEMLLEKAGLTKGIHFTTQSSFRDEMGKVRRPDLIINLPEGKHLVIDSKVSLVAYERFFNADNKVDEDKFLKQHVDSLRNHIRDLSQKKYQNIYQINSPDYLLLFVPIEPAFSLAVQQDQKVFLDALDRNIVIVTTSTLLATMRTVSYIWKQEKQKKSVMEIARQSGLLYDKFVNFVEDLKNVGIKIDQAKNSYNGAMNKLNDSTKHGDTLVGRAEKIKSLGAKTSKSIPEELLGHERLDQ